MPPDEPVLVPQPISWSMSLNARPRGLGRLVFGQQESRRSAARNPLVLGPSTGNGLYLAKCETRLVFKIAALIKQKEVCLCDEAQVKIVMI